MGNKGETRYRKWYCPNCSKLVSGVIEYSGDVNVKCRSCGAIMTLRRIGRRKHEITVIITDDEPTEYAV